MTPDSTPHAVNVEEMEGRWIAHVSALPGCFASDTSMSAALAAVPQAVAAYGAWLRAHGADGPAEPMQAEVSEVHRAWNSQPDYEVNAFFASDRPPLTRPEIDRALQLLDLTRADLLAAAEGLSPEALAREIEDDWSIARILKHVGGAEWWYLDRLSLAFPRDQVAVEPFARLDQVRAHFRATLPGLAGDERLTEPDHETWSPRKVLRRALWHERDHTAHIHQFRARLAEHAMGAAGKLASRRD